jgi:cytochrome c5
MADRSTAFDPLDDHEQWQVTAYLTALSPQLQRSTQQLRDAQADHEQARAAVEQVESEVSDDSAFDGQKAKALVETKCSQCHELSLVAESPPTSRKAAQELVASMVEEGLSATAEELALIITYLERAYVQ